jgi:hypothetical protein
LLLVLLAMMMPNGAKPRLRSPGRTHPRDRPPVAKRPPEQPKGPPPKEPPPVAKRMPQQPKGPPPVAVRLQQPKGPPPVAKRRPQQPKGPPPVAKDKGTGKAKGSRSKDKDKGTGKGSKSKVIGRREVPLKEGSQVRCEAEAARKRPRESDTSALVAAIDELCQAIRRETEA